MVVYHYKKPELTHFAGCEQVLIRPIKYPIIDTENSYISWMDYSEQLNVQDIAKINIYINCFKKLVKVPGDIIELGVFRGANLKLLGLTYDYIEPHSSRNILGFDTFEGFPEKQLNLDQEKNKSKTYSGEGNLDAAIRKMANLKRDVRLIKGDVMETLPKFYEQWSNKVALVYMDLDLEKPTRLALNLYRKILSKGGIILLDQYSRDSWSETTVVDEFMEKYHSEFLLEYFPQAGAPTCCLTKI